MPSKKRRSTTKTAEREKALEMIVNGERQIVNIMADSGLGATTIGKVWDKAKLKGLIGKSETLGVSSLVKANKIRKEGKPLSRISGERFSMPKGDNDDKNHPTLETSVVSQEKDEKPPGKVGTQDKSEGNSEIVTSIEKMRLEMKTNLGEMNSRLKQVEQASTGTSKPPPENNQEKPAFVDLTQTTVHEQSDPSNPAEKTNASDKKPPEVPKGHSRVKLPSTDGKEHIEILPDAPLATNNGWKVVFDNQDALVNPPLLVTAFAICLTSS